MNLYPIEECQTKVCNTCGEDLPLNDFYTDKKGLANNAMCKKCCALKYYNKPDIRTKREARRKKYFNKLKELSKKVKQQKKLIHNLQASKSQDKKTIEDLRDKTKFANNGQNYLIYARPYSSFYYNGRYGNDPRRFLCVNPQSVVTKLLQTDKELNRSDLIIMKVNNNGDNIIALENDINNIVYKKIY